MVTINYQSYGKNFNLRLRLYQHGETKYINVNKLLQGDLQEKHWSQKKQMFKSTAPFSDENNEILFQFKHKYESLAVNWAGSLSSFMLIVENGYNEAIAKPTMHKLFQRIIDDYKCRKHEDGTTKGSYEAYEKCERRIKEFCEFKKIKYDSLMIEEVTSDFINLLFDWIKNVRGGKGFRYISTMLHATLVKIIQHEEDKERRMG